MAESNDITASEIWKPIPGFEGAFDASTHGRIRANRRYAGSRWYEERIMRLSPLRAGYLKVNLSHRGEVHQRKVHQLILETFVGPCPKGEECRHLNGVRSDNRLENLAWGTKQENADDRVRHDSMPKGERHPHAKLSESDVREIRDVHRDGDPLKPIADRFGVSKTHIIAVRRRRCWRHLT